MTRSEELIQNPAPGRRMVKFCGDVVVFTLELPRSQDGTAWVRTNIGQAKVIRREIFRQVEQDETPLGRAWFDIPMKRIDPRSFRVTLPLCESGHFEAKCFFLKKNKMSPRWPQGPNTVINVDSAEACCANVIYNAFVRQFGPNVAGAGTLDDAGIKTISELDDAGFTVIPPSGTFRDLIDKLDFPVAVHEHDIRDIVDQGAVILLVEAQDCLGRLPLLAQREAAGVFLYETLDTQR